MIAMLGMYDLPPMHSSNDRLWTAIRGRLGFGPDHLTRDRDYWEMWRDKDLVFAQTCGMPYRTSLHGHVGLVGTPDYGLPGCPPGMYFSVLVARADDARDLPALAEGRFAYNEALSQSGWSAPILHLETLGLRPGAVVATGAHARSVAAVAEGRADLAGIDALTWTLLEEQDPDLTARLRVVDTTPPTPALPYITGRGQDADRIAAAVQAAIDDLDPADRAALHLRGLVRLPAEDYLAIRGPATGPGAYAQNGGT
jgi:ABC-type phosphate/phosphonate transport system substrate-binding protein